MAVLDTEDGGEGSKALLCWVGHVGFPINIPCSERNPILGDLGAVSRFQVRAEEPLGTLDL